MPAVGEEWDFIILLLKTIAREGPLNQTRLAQLTGTNKNKIGRYVEALRVRGLIEKRVDPGPPRQTLIELTEQGKCILSCLEKMV